MTQTGTRRLETEGSKRLEGHRAQRWAAAAGVAALITTAVVQAACAPGAEPKDGFQVIENACLKVSVATDGGAFQITEKAGGRTVLTDGHFLVGRGPAKIGAIVDNVFGNGQTIELSGASVCLFQSLPFALFRAELRNESKAVQVMNRIPMLSLTLHLDKPADALTALGTGGLAAPAEGQGSYSWLAVADPATRNGLVVGWLTHHRASGVVLPSVTENRVGLQARADYGCLRLAPGATAPMEMLVVGYFEDARLGLEAYADAIAAVHAIKLPIQPSGHCTWYYARALNERDLPGVAEFIGKELAPFGYDFIQIDDGWQAGLRRNGPGKDFSTWSTNGPYKTGGMKAAAEQICQQGLTPGLWLIPFAGTEDDPVFADRQHWFVKRADDGRPYKVKWGGTCLDLTLPEVQVYVHDVVRRIVKEWGFSYLKLDGLWTGMATGMAYVNDVYKEDSLGNAAFANPDKTNVEAYRDGLKIVRKAAGPDAFILGCNVAQNMRTYGASFGLADAMRVGPDNKPEWLFRGEYRLLAGPRTGTRSYFLNRRVWYNDPDPVYVRDSMPLEHSQLICSWVALSGSLTVTSDSLGRLSPERLNILKRIVPPHQAAARPVDLFEEPLARIWLVTDGKGSARRNVIGLFNWDDHDYSFDYSLKKIGLPDNEYVEFDYWGNRFAGSLRGSLKVTLPPRSCRILAVRTVSDHPQVISSSRHVTQGIVDVNEEKWDAASLTLSGVSRVVENDPYELRIVLPAREAYEVDTAVAAGKRTETTLEGTGLRVRFPEMASGEVAWQIRFLLRR